MLANGKLLRAAAYGPTIVAYRNGNPVRLDEVAHVYDGVENDKSAAWYNGERGDLPGHSETAGHERRRGGRRGAALLPTFREQLPAAVDARRPHRPRRCRSASRCTTSS